jgi:GNAT superfamily N-acetyltransferase
MIIDISKLEINKVNAEDIPELIRYRIDYLTEMQGTRDKLYLNKLASKMTSFFKKSISEGSFFGLVATIESEIIAYGGMVIRHIPGDFSNSVYLEADILNMYTIPAARKRGVSGQILLRLIQEAKSMGITKLCLHTSVDGENLYRSAGFSDPSYPYLELPLI